MELLRTDDSFYALQGDRVTKIKNYDVDPLLKKLNKKQLANFLKSGYIKVSQAGEDLKLEGMPRGKGGGPIAGMCAAWMVRAIMYTGGATVGGGAIVVSTATTGPGGVALAGATVPAWAAYMATTEGAATAAAILGYSLVWLP